MPDLSHLSTPRGRRTHRSPVPYPGGRGRTRSGYTFEHVRNDLLELCVLERTTIVVGNPKPRSRTSATAATVAAFVADQLKASPEITTIELPDLGTGLLGWGDEAVGQAVAAAKEADLLVVASPTYKATFTGLLKLFLDQIGADELAGVATVPVMVGASAAHALAVEVHLRPVLVELGAAVPTRGLYLQESELEDLGPVLERWWGPAEGLLRALLG